MMTTGEVGKRIGLLVGLGLLLLLGSVQPARAQASDTTLLAEIETALGRGDVGMLLGRSAERLEISLFGSGAAYSQAQAQYVLQEFFRDFPPQGFRFQPPSRHEDSALASGTYRQSDAPLAVYVRLRREGARWELKEIRIDRKPGE